MQTFGGFRPQRFSDGFKQLEKELREGSPKPHKASEGVIEIPLREVRLVESVFQPRTLEGGHAASEEHIRGLMKAIRDNADHKLTPIEVWWSGKAWIVLDGHHRYWAYQRSFEQSISRRKREALKTHCQLMVPAVVFDGTLMAAIKRSREANSRDKLVMSKRDKLNGAWQMVAIDQQMRLKDPNGTHLTRDEIAHACGVSKRTVATMRAKFKDLVELGSNVPPEDLMWSSVLAEVTPDRGDYEDNISKNAQQIVEKLSKTFGGKLAKMPDAVALALWLYDSRLPALMAETQQWSDAVRVEDDEIEEEEIEEEYA